MKFKVTRTSDTWNKKQEEIEIKTLEELINWINNQEHEVIVSDGYIEIYDDYRE